MGKALYLECTSGISGDMLVAALLDLGVSHDKVMHALKSLPLQGFDIEITRVKKSGIDACDFNVVLDEQHKNNDHDMDYLYGSTSSVPHVSQEKNASGAQKEHAHGKHEHEHRSLSDIQALIDAAAFSERAKSIASDVFEILATAEAAAHAIDVNKVHFHEVGAIDSIVDVVAFALCMDLLDITEVVVPFFCEGWGSVRCQHGVIPVPVPAVVNIVQRYRIPLHVLDVRGELVTPTGAACAAAIRTQEALPAYFTIEQVGIGAGKRLYETAGTLRAMILSPCAE